jgi:signal transduction histidine kinase
MKGFLYIALAQSGDILQQGPATCFLPLNIIPDNRTLLIIGLLALIHVIIFTVIGRHWRKDRRTITRHIEKLEEANKKLVSSEKKLLHESAIKSKMYSIMAHDLRNPSNAIIGFSQLLANNPEKYSKQEIQKFAGIINRSARNVYVMLDNLLEWSKAQNEYLQIKHEQFDLHAHILNIFTLFELASISKNIELQCIVHKGIKVNTDKNILSTILRNLIDNALKFTPEGGIISISCVLRTSLIEIHVEDTGPGISEDKIATLFQLTNKKTDSHEFDFSTHGLGLILCKDFVEMLGGRIWVDSTLGKGSIFKFELPFIDQ